MEIAAIGVSHKEASVHIRGQVAFTTSMKEASTRQLLNAGIEEFMIISTCNRSEIYIASNKMAKDIEVIKSLYIQMAGRNIMSYLFVKTYEVALQHIYQVASGINSLIIGEDQILGQMKDALSYAIANGSAKKYMTKVVRETVTFSKKIRTVYRLSENQLSVASIGIKYLKERHEDLRHQKILIIGTGEMGRLFLKYLEADKVEQIYLTNRIFNKAKMPQVLAANVQLIEYDDRYKYLNQMDIVISTTASPHIIFKASELPELERQLTMLDMAVPRDIDEAIDQLPQVHVATLDDFEQIASKHKKQRQETASQINRLILDEVKKMELWLLRAKIDRIIKHLHYEQYKAVEEAIRQLSKELGISSKQEQPIKAIITRAVGKMMKEPIKQLKQLEEVEEIHRYKMMLEKLFNVEGGAN